MAQDDLDFAGHDRHELGPHGVWRQWAFLAQPSRLGLVPRHVCPFEVQCRTLPFRQGHQPDLVLLNVGLVCPLPRIHPALVGKLALFRMAMSGGSFSLGRILLPATPWGNKKAPRGRGFSEPISGLEPLTYALRMRCSTS